MHMFNNVSQSTGHNQAIACLQHNEPPCYLQGTETESINIKIQNRWKIHQFHNDESQIHVATSCSMKYFFDK